MILGKILGQGQGHNQGQHKAKQSDMSLHSRPLDQDMWPEIHQYDDGNYQRNVF